MSATTSLYPTSPSVYLARQQEGDPVVALPASVRRRGRTILVHDAASLLALLVAGAGLLVAAGASPGMLDQLRALGTLIVIAALPMAMTLVSVFTAVAAAERRTRADDAPAPVRSVRRHAIMWSLFGGLSTLAAVGLLDGVDYGLTACVVVGAAVMLGAEVGVLLGRGHERVLILASACAVTTSFLVLLLTRGTAAETSGLLTLVGGASAAVLVSRTGSRDTVPGTPVWTRHHVAWSMASQNATIVVLGAVVPISLILTLGTTAPLLPVLLIGLPSALVGVVERPRLASMRRGTADRAWTLTWRAGPAVITMAIASVVSYQLGWVMLGSALVGALVAVACLTGSALVATGDPRTCLGLTGAVLALIGVVIHLLPLVALGAALSAILAVDRMLTYQPPTAGHTASEALPQLSTDPFRVPKPLWSAGSLVDVSIVVPFLNADPAALVAHVGRIREALGEAGHTFEVIVVDDGSTNGAADVLEAVPWRNVYVVRHTANRGKGGALATGFSRARGRHIGFIDADGDISADHLAVYVAQALESDADIILADKTHRDSVNGSSSGRQLTSKVMHLVNRSLGLSVVDTQTGAKLFRRELLQESLPRMWENGFAFDVELLVMAQHLGYDSVQSMPVHIERDGGSTVSMRATLRTGLRVLGIARRMLLADYYYGPRAGGQDPLWRELTRPELPARSATEWPTSSADAFPHQAAS